MMMLRRKWEDPTGSDTPPQRRATAMVAQGREHAARDPHVLTLALIASHEHGTQSGRDAHRRLVNRLEDAYAANCVIAYANAAEEADRRKRR
jgi:hypothetical protein